MISRILPLLLMTGTVATAAKEGPAAVKRVTDTVLVVLQRSEVQGFANILRNDAALGSSLPSPGDAAGLAGWLAENGQGMGGRDVSVDRWHNPLRLERLRERDLVLVSLGPNGTRDGCPAAGESSNDQDDICEEIQVPRGQRSGL